MVSEQGSQQGGLPLFLTMFWIAGLPLFMLFSGRLLESVPGLKADRVAYLAATLPLVVMALRQPRSLQAPGRVEAAMALYLAVILLSWATTLPSKDMGSIKQDADFLLSCFAMPFTAFFIARNTQWTRERLTTCLWVLVGGVGVYLLLFGAVQYTYDWNFLVPDAAKNIHPERAKGPFDNSVPYGVVVAMLVPITLFVYLRSSRRALRFILVAIAIGLVQSIVACKTRAVWAALPLALLLPALRYPGLRRLSALLVGQLAVQVVVAGVIGLDFWGLQRRLTQPEQVYDRIAVSATASNMIEHQPLFGFGFGMLTFNEGKSNYLISWGGLSPHWAVYPNNPHNDFLNVLVMMGVFGLIPFIALLAVNWQLLRRGRALSTQAHPGQAELATFVQGAFLVMLICGFMHSVMHMSYAQVLFYFLLGIVAHGAVAPIKGIRRSDDAAPPERLLAPAAVPTMAAGGER